MSRPMAHSVVHGQCSEGRWWVWWEDARGVDERDCYATCQIVVMSCVCSRACLLVLVLVVLRRRNQAPQLVVLVLTEEGQAKVVDVNCPVVTPRSSAPAVLRVVHHPRC